MNPPALPSAIAVREVGLRDGLQSIARTLPTAHKLQWIQAAYDAGLREIEVGSFVPARLLPQLADTAELVAFAKTLPDLVVTVLVPNFKGAERALECGVHSMVLPLSASRAHSLANQRKSAQDVLAEVARIVELRNSTGSTTQIEIGISTAFGCTLQGRVEPSEVQALVRASVDAGVDSLGLADTVGYANPAMVRSVFAQARAIAGTKLNRCHFHDTRGLGLANTYAALEEGVSCVDASLAGIGGCPHAPGASGNVSTEDVAWMLLSMGIHTGIDMKALLQLRVHVAQWLEGEQLHGSIWRAGLPKTLLAAANAMEKSV